MDTAYENQIFTNRYVIDFCPPLLATAVIFLIFFYWFIDVRQARGSILGPATMDDSVY